ncbi:hypothetical protein CYMTET_53082 [Cymbomonas tetramitiformis]|uniref:Transmembrane protein n=1 Tax=Cymbomonas tetramitiformis TaxID=36881 RepID=A0AAE0EQE4_9CHLO|nr:hypothetical protein CYMTET_53082 [Cymbomonas tetramitiformis]
MRFAIFAFVGIGFFLATRFQKAAVVEIAALSDSSGKQADFWNCFVSRERFSGCFSAHQDSGASGHKHFGNSRRVLHGLFSGDTNKDPGKDDRLQFSREDHMDLYTVKRDRDRAWQLAAEQSTSQQRPAVETDAARRKQDEEETTALESRLQKVSVEERLAQLKERNAIWTNPLPTMNILRVQGHDEDDTGQSQASEAEHRLTTPPPSAPLSGAFNDGVLALLGTGEKKAESREDKAAGREDVAGKEGAEGAVTATKVGDQNARIDLGLEAVKTGGELLKKTVNVEGIPAANAGRRDWAGLSSHKPGESTERVNGVNMSSSTKTRLGNISVADRLNQLARKRMGQNAQKLAGALDSSLAMIERELEASKEHIMAYPPPALMKEVKSQYSVIEERLQAIDLTRQHAKDKVTDSLGYFLNMASGPDSASARLSQLQAARPERVSDTEILDSIIGKLPPLADVFLLNNASAPPPLDRDW